ncbi:MAG: hypothetical protein H0U62_02385 [Actinobacteria bacterium]|nr:hypothetical protein [Actinomycetota bacterium]
MTPAAMTAAALKGAATAPQVLGSVAILLVVGPLVPAWAGFGLGLGMVTVLVVTTGLCESTAARLLRGAHKATRSKNDSWHRWSLTCPHPGTGRQA